MRDEVSPPGSKSAMAYPHLCADERADTVGELAIGLTHELKQPLGTMVLNCAAAALLLKSSQAEVQEYVGALTQATEAGLLPSKVIRHLRDLLRRHDEPCKVCTLDAPIRSVATLIGTAARDDDVEPDLDVELDMPKVRVDQNQIKRVLVNPARNSIQEMSQHDAGVQNRMVIRARRSLPEQLMVSVADTGHGLHRQEMYRPFDLFDNTKRGGMGTGLAISRTIIEPHGGRSWIDHRTRQGATMHFSLPTLRNENRAD